MEVSRKEMVGKMITKYGFENEKTIKFAETAEHMDFSDKHVEVVFQALYGEEEEVDFTCCENCRCCIFDGGCNKRIFGE